MSLIKNLFFLFTVTIFAIASVVLNIFNYNPFQANFREFANFYASFLVALAGIITILIYYIKTKVTKNETIYKSFWSSTRQGLFVSIGTTTLMILLGMKILDWLIGISVVVVIVLLELFFQTKKAK